VVGRIRKSVDEGNVYDEKVPLEKLQQVLKKLVKEEFIRSGILATIEQTPKTAEEIAEEIDVPVEIVFKNIARLWKKQIVLPSGHKGLSPTYTGGALK
jgi:predicted transcriptional regulator